MPTNIVPQTETLAQHPPAIKVGGRRLSISSRPKPAASAPDIQRANSPDGADAPDYPRPVAPSEREERQEEDGPKKKQGGGGDEHERRIQESLHRKAEHNRPKKEFTNGPKTLQRVNQPAGKSFGI